jgi:hypothetical protein
VGDDRIELDLFVAGSQRARVDGLEVRGCDRFGPGYAHDHPQLEKWIPKDRVLTHLHGSLAPTDDLVVRWVEFRSHRDSFYSAGALDKFRLLSLRMTLFVLALGVLIAIVRQAEDPSGSMRRRFAAALVAPVVIGAVLGAIGLVLPSGDAMYDTGTRFRTMRQRRLARVLYDDGHRSVDALHRGFVEAGLEPFDGPGGFTIERGGDGLLYFYGYEADGSIRIESIGRASGPK